MSVFFKALLVSSFLVLASCAHHNCHMKQEGCKDCKNDGQCQMKHAEETKK